MPNWQVGASGLGGLRGRADCGDLGTCKVPNSATSAAKQHPAGRLEVNFDSIALKVAATAACNSSPYLSRSNCSPLSPDRTSLHWEHHSQASITEADGPWLVLGFRRESQDPSMPTISSGPCSRGIEAAVCCEQVSGHSLLHVSLNVLSPNREISAKHP